MSDVTRQGAYEIPAWAIAQTLAATMTRAITGLGLLPPCDFCWHPAARHAQGLRCSVARVRWTGDLERCQCVQYERGGAEGRGER